MRRITFIAVLLIVLGLVPPVAVPRSALAVEPEASGAQQTVIVPAESSSPAPAGSQEVTQPAQTGIGLDELEVGDLLICRQEMFLVLFVFYTHLGIYVGNGLVAEARLDGVKLYPVSDWAYPRETYVRYLRVKTSEEKRRQAAAWAVAQTQRKPPPCYAPLPTRNANPNKRTWYCSELVWASYYWQGVDLFTRGGIGPSRGRWVTTDRVFHDDDVYEIGSHTERLPLPGWPPFYPCIIL